MKKLLVLTDFTPTAAHAEAAAVQLSAKLGAAIVLYHTLPYIPLIPGDNRSPYIGTGDMLFEDSKERLIQEADALREAAVMTPGSEVAIEEKNGEGCLSDGISELSEGQEIEMVIMGGRSTGALDHMLGGSDTWAVIRRSHKPVWIIPLMAASDIPKKIIFATDFGAAGLPALDFLLNLIKLLGAQLDVVHVIRQDEVVTEIGAEVAFRKFLVHRGLTCTQVIGKNVCDSLQQYGKDHGADLLAMAHGHHTFISRLFGHSESYTAISDQQLAVLIFPPDYK